MTARLQATAPMHRAQKKLLDQGRIRLGKGLAEIADERERAAIYEHFEDHWKPVPRRPIPPDVQDRVRQSRASLAIQGAPLLYKPSPHPANPNDPSPEWKARNAGFVSSEVVGKGEHMPVRRYRTRHVLEHYAEKFDMDRRTAIERFIADATIGASCGVVDPNRSRSQALPGSKLGGLGNVPQYVRDSFARHQYVWQRLAPDLRRTATVLLTREATRPDGSPFSLEDFGAEMFPMAKDKVWRRASAAGALWMLAGVIRWLYATCPVQIAPIEADLVDGDM